jgi:hypothetical protein
MKISIRHFLSTKEGRRASFVAKEIIINGKNPTVKSLFEQYTEITPSTHRVARGIIYLQLTDTLIEGEILNIIPI